MSSENEVVETLDDNANGKNAVAGEMGKAARDGKFEFTVKSMDCTRASIGPAALPSKAQGTFYDAKGTQYSNDASAELAANENSATFLNQINPGNSVTGKLVYDVPKGTKLTEIELHDSMFSAGVKVPLK